MEALVNLAEQGDSGLQPLVFAGAREVGPSSRGAAGGPPAQVGGFLAASLQGGKPSWQVSPRHFQPWHRRGCNHALRRAGLVPGHTEPSHLPSLSLSLSTPRPVLANSSAPSLWSLRAGASMIKPLNVDDSSHRYELLPETSLLVLRAGCQARYKAQITKGKQARAAFCLRVG